MIRMKKRGRKKIKRLSFFIILIILAHLLNPTTTVTPVKKYQLKSFYESTQRGMYPDLVGYNLPSHIRTVNIRSTKKAKIITDFNVKRRGFIDDDDHVPPIIKLTGPHEIILTVGELYQEFGYIAYDNVDGDLTDQVKVSGVIDFKTPGVYHLTYEVFDNSENKFYITRIIQVKPKQVASSKVIYLTFDDGPSASITSNILDILKEEEVLATFFVIHHAPHLDQFIKRAYDEGHTIGLHSYTHNYAEIYESEMAYFADLALISDHVKQITGVESKIIRFPGGTSNEISKRYNTGIMTRLSKQVLERGYQYFDWNVSSGDAGDVFTKEKVYEQVISGLTKDSNMVLLHDYENNYKTLDALRDIIHYGKKHGFQFKAIDQSTPAVKHQPNN